MEPHNLFIQCVRARSAVQIGLWCSLGSPVTVEICAGAGFDWLMLDMEHAPNELRDIYGQLQAASSYPTHCVVRPDSADPVKIKRLLDVGVRTILLPYIESQAQAQAAVAAVRYPPRGIRGVTLASGANRFGRHSSAYFASCDTQIGLILQVETRAGLAQLEEIASVEGVDAIFLGPADLSADLGYLGDPRAPVARAAFSDAVRRLNAIGKPWGTLTAVEEDVREAIRAGAAFVAAGSDQGSLVKSVDALALKYRAVPGTA